MALHEEVQVLRRIPIFSKFEPSRLKLLAFSSRIMTFDKGQELFRQGDTGDAAYIIIHGEVEVFIEGPQGDTPIARLGKHELVGEIAILIDVPRTATVRSLTELKTLVISKDLFSRMLDEFPEIAVDIMRELAFRLERTTAQLGKASKHR